MSEDIKSKEIMFHVAEIIIEELKLEDVTPETFGPDLDLVDELGIDSMDPGFRHSERFHNILKKSLKRNDFPGIKLTFREQAYERNKRR